MADLPETKVSTEIKIFNSGWVTSKKGMVIAGAGNEIVRMPALFTLIRHPDHGVILYDTGYHTQFFPATSKFPYSLLRKATPVERTEDDDAVVQLEKAGIGADEVKTIIIGHGHVDHIPGAVDFPKAKIIIDRREWAYMQGHRLKIFPKGYIKSFYEDLPNEIKLIDFALGAAEIGPFAKAIDLWGDSSMILVPLEGHTVGQMGLLVNQPDGKSYLFISDAAWLSENYLAMKAPSLMARTILNSYRNFKSTLQLLNDIHHEYPNIKIVPCHCPDVYEKLQASGMAY